MAFKEIFSETTKKIKAAVVDDKMRRKYQFACVYAVLGIVSACMTVLNIATEKGLLTYATLFFALLCTAMAALLFHGNLSLKLSETIFTISLYILFIYFIISGNPDGFSILWTALLPAAGMLLFGREKGSIASLGMFLILLFLLETPLGRSLLQYDYSETFTQRYPLLYMAFFAIGLLLESIRNSTYGELEKLREKYKFQSCHDALTGVYNRQGFNDMMDFLVANRRGVFSLLILDLDRFKNINDTYGHIQGDKMLIKTAQILVDAAGENGKVCRWGGEEFAILLDDCSSGAEFAEKIRRAVGSTSVEYEGSKITVTTSVGEVTVEDMSATAQAIVTAADRCLYSAKEAGRNCVVSTVLK